MADLDLLHHYTVLKQFLDISDDSSSRVKSSLSRAVRAREKLLKLSLAQFRELSTDVYDELRRRIDELRSEPDFLLPKLTFHPKRNQARQKLALLPQTRFKDLVCDISYEIERRDLHIPVSTPSSRSFSDVKNGQESGTYTSPGRYEPSPRDAHYQNEKLYEGGNLQQQRQQQDHSQSQHRQQQQPLQHQHTQEYPLHFQQSPEQNYTQNLPLAHAKRASHASLIDTSHVANLTPVNDLATPELRESVPKQNFGVQSTTVVPTKANLTWSSDEEGDGDNDEPQQLSLGEQFIKATNGRESTIPTAIPGHDRGMEPELPTHAATANFANAAGADSSPNATNHLDSVPLHQHQQLENELAQLKEQHAAVASERDSLKEEVAQLARANDDHVARSLKLPTTEQVVQLQQEIESMKATSAALRLENQSLKKTHSRSVSGDLIHSQFHSDGTIQSSSSRNSRDVNGELAKLYERIESLGTPKSPKSESLLRAEAETWKAKYQANIAKDRATQIAASIPDSAALQKLVAADGIVSVKSAALFFGSLEVFIDSLNTPKVSTDAVFESASKMGIAASEIVKVSQGSQNVSAVRSAVSHALTTTRYYVTHNGLVPKILVERAASELAFAVCEFISEVRLIDKLATLTQGSTSRILEDPTEGTRALKIASKLKLIDANSAKDSAYGDKVSKEPGQFDALTSKPSAGESFATRKDADPIIPEQKASAFDKEQNTPKKPSIFERLTNATSSNKASSGDNAVSSEETTNGSLKNSIEKDVISTPERKNGTPQVKKSNILDKVKQFENSPSDKLSPTRKGVEASPTGLVKSATAKLSESATPDRDAKLKKAEDLVGENQQGLARGRSIFQSLRDRFTTDTAKEDTSKSDDPNTLTTADADVPDAAISASPRGIDQPVQRELNDVTNTPRSANDTLKVHGSGSEGGLTSIPHRVTESLSMKKIEPGSPLLKKVDTKSPVEESANTENAQTTPTRSADKNMKTLPESANDGPGSPLANRALKTAGLASLGSSLVTPKANEALPLAKSDSVELTGEKKSNFRLPMKSPSFKVKKVSYTEPEPEEPKEQSQVAKEEVAARQRQEYRKSMAAATFNFDLFDIDDPDNTLTQVLLYLEHQTIQVISTIQGLLSAIKKPDATRGQLRENSMAISRVIGQMTEATNTSMNQTRNHQLKEHGSWVVKSLEDCNHRMSALCRPNADKDDLEFADKHFKQRLAGISFDIAKCTKELVKTVEEASLKEDIAQLDARLNHADDLT